MGTLGRLAGQPAWRACMLGLSATQSIPHDANATLATAAWTEVAWDLENLDPENWHASPNLGRIAPSGFQGQMAFYASGFVQWAANTTGIRRARIMKNSGGTPTLVVSDAQSASNATVGPISISDFVLLSPGDYVTLEVTQNSGCALNVAVQSSLSLAPLPS